MKRNEQKLREEKGITLIALIVTIIVLIILATVTIIALTGENNILENAQLAKVSNAYRSIEDQIKLSYMSIVSHVQVQTAFNALYSTNTEANAEEILKILQNDLKGNNSTKYEFGKKTSTVTDVEGTTRTIVNEIWIKSKEGQIEAGRIEEGVPRYDGIIYTQIILNGQNVEYKFDVEKPIDVTFLTASGIPVAPEPDVPANPTEPENPEGLVMPEIEITEITNKTLKINVINDYEKDVQFEYYVNGTKIGEKTSEKICNVENLSFNTEYEIKVIAYLEEEKKEAKTIVRTTMTDILVLFDNGNQCEDITGGWTGFFGGGDKATNGSTSISEMLTCSTWGTWTGYVIVTNNAIDISEYSQIVYEINEHKALYISSAMQSWFGLYQGVGGIHFDVCLPWDGNSLTEYRYDFSNKTDKYQIGFATSNGVHLSVSKIYLLK